jgi:uncharacterized protein YkwD
MIVLLVITTLITDLCATPQPVVAQDPAAAVLAQANVERRRAGLDTLERHEALDRAAREHAEELARRNTLDHTSIDPARATMEQRIELAGVVSFRRLGENLAFSSHRAVPLHELVVSLWLDSEGHRENLLERRFDRAGTGVARAANGTWYVVQLYGSGIRTR